jgi:WD40 repeat protein
LVAGRRLAGDGYFAALLTPSTRRLLDGVAVCVLAEERRAPDSLIDMRTGGNDNAVRVWSASKLGAGAQELQGHGAAVKALAWSPHARGRLATGGGTADRCIKLWNASTGVNLNSVDTGSQVCALAWSSAEDALVSTCA